jgi:hypothetical protein
MSVYVESKNVLLQDPVYHVDGDDVFHHYSSCDEYSLWQVGADNLFCLELLKLQSSCSKLYFHE